MKIQICLGNSCHMKGSRQIVEQLQRLVAEHGLSDRVELGGTFCTGNCQQGVCVTVDGVPHSVMPATVQRFFEDEVLKKA